uniref:TF-B3 domain-containing protein n=1 Tax=Fagus sylvatica TaxID=28930 RepID=A0A2N9JCA9_FAGSY
MVKAPHFFKIILADSLRDGKLKIPKKFIRKYGQGLSNQAFLKLPNGAQWKVELTEGDGEVWLQKGWLEFVKYNSVRQGNFMIFRYEGNSDFYVLIFDESATEIDYRSDGEEGKLDEDFEAPNMEEINSEISVEILDDFLSSPCPKTRDKSPLPCLRPHKIMKTNSSGKIASTSQPCRQFKETKLEKLKTKANANATMRDFKAKGGVKGINATKRCSKAEVLGKIQPLTNSEKARALQKASAFIRPESPYFMIVIQPSYLKILDIPTKFVKRYLNRTQGNVILWVSDGRNWTVRYTCHVAAEQRKGKFKCGWRAFAQDNNLKVGDVCAFELIKGTQMSFKVVIFHVTQEHCPLPPAHDNGVNQVESKINIKLEFEYTGNHETGMSSARYDSTTKELKLSQGHFTTEPQGTQSNEMKLKKLKGNANSPSCIRSFPGGLNISAKEEGRGMSDSPRCPQSHDFRMRQRLTNSEKTRALERASAFNSENPFFMVVLQPSYIHGCCNLASGGRKWSVKYELRRRNRCESAELCRGWREFARDNNFEVGDVCVFEFIKGNEISLKVSIFRATVDANRHLVSSKSNTGKFKQLKCDESINELDTQRPSSSLRPPRVVEFVSENPFFKVIIGSAYLVHGLNIPFSFFKRGCITQSGQILMLQVGDKSWPVKLLMYPHLSSGTLSAGWFAFARDNTLQIGDVCVFELIKSDNVVLKVSIFRHLS